MATSENPKEMKIVVLGASGQVGAVIYEELRKKYLVTGTSRTTSPSLLQFDPFTDHWSGLGEPDVILNCIGQIQSSNNSSFSKIHGELTRHLIEHRRLLGNPRIIQISALGASATHQVEFLRTKGEADDYLLQFPNATVIRPSIVCTHRTMLVGKMLILFKISRWTRGLVFLPRGFPDRQVQPVMGEDLASIIDHLCNASRIPKILNVTGPQRLHFRDIIQMMFEARRKKYHIVEIPKLSTDLLVKHGLSAIFPDLINSQQYELLFSDNVANHSEAESYLGKPMRDTRHFWMKEFGEHARD